MIAARQIAFGKAAGAKKPYDAEIECLESTGTQWIDTGLTPQLSSDVWEIDLQRLQTGTVPWGCLNYTEASGYGRYFSASAISGFMTGLDTHRMLLKVDAPQKKIFKNKELENLPDYSKYFTVQAEGRLWLFGRSDTGALGICRIYAVKCLRKGILILDLIPVRVGDVGYMYDRVSGQLFGNQGTGEFVLGPDIIDYTAKDYIQDGLVAIADAKDKLFTGGFKADMFDLSNGYLDNTVAIEMPNIISDSSYVTLESVCGEITQGTTQNAYPFNLSRDGKEKSPMFWVDGLSDRYTQWRVICPKDTSTNSYNFKAKSEIVYLFSLSIDPNRCYFYTNSKANGNFACFNDGTFMGLLLRPDSRRCVRLYNRALTAEEIVYNYNIDKQRFGL